MPKLIDVTSEADILPAYRGTPVADLLRYHCLKAPQPARTARPQMLIAMCIDHRKSLTIPNEFAYVIRAAGTRLLGNEFELTYAIGVDGVDTIALIGHTQCGMTRVLTQREQFIEGLVERGGISREAAAEHYDASAPGYAIDSPIESIIHKSKVVRKFLPNLLVAPLLYRVEDDQLTQIVPPGVPIDSPVLL